MTVPLITIESHICRTTSSCLFTLTSENMPVVAKKHHLNIFLHEPFQSATQSHNLRRIIIISKLPTSSKPARKQPWLKVANINFPPLFHCVESLRLRSSS